MLVEVLGHNKAVGSSAAGNLLTLPLSEILLLSSFDYTIIHYVILM